MMDDIMNPANLNASQGEGQLEHSETPDIKEITNPNMIKISSDLEKERREKPDISSAQGLMSLPPLHRKTPSVTS